MSMMKTILKNARESNNMMIRELAEALKIDAALVSKWEKGVRKPTKNQVIKLAEILGLNTESLLIEWMSEKIIYEIGDDELARKAMILAESKINYNTSNKNEIISKSLGETLDKIDDLKKTLIGLRTNDSYRIAQALELEYTFESNRIEGNTLTLQETDLVINEGITISGKSMREHLEAINHKEAIEYLKSLVEKKSDFKEKDVLMLHHLILRGIDTENAGKYRSVQVMIKGSKHLPPQPYLVAKQMEDLFLWYELNKRKLHPIILAAEFSERLVTIHPFIDGNGRTSRLIMNLILLKNGFVIANIKGDIVSRLEYYSALEKAQVEADKTNYHKFIAKVQHDAIKNYLRILGYQTS